MESEIVSHEPLIEMATLSAQQMIQSKHFAADDIQKKMDHLTFQLGELKCCMVMQRQILQAALEAEKVIYNLCVFFYYFCLACLIVSIMIRIYLYRDFYRVISVW